MSHPFLRFLLLALLASSAPALHAQRERLSPAEIEYVEKEWPNAKKTSTGIRYVVLQEGDGPSPRPGQRVGVTYIGRLLQGPEFDSRLNRDDPLVFRVARGDVIVGWDQLLQAMKLNEKRLAIIPAELAYGSRGRPPSIPRDATLVFEMELVSIMPPPH